MLKKSISLFMALVLVMSFSMTAMAAEEALPIIELNSDNIVQVEEVIGSLEDQDGVLLEDPVVLETEIMPATTDINKRTLFSMTAAKVYNLLTSMGSSGKNFTGGAMDAFEGEGIYVEGTLNLSVGTGGPFQIKVGTCYYDASSDTFVSVGYHLFTSGESDYYWWPKSDGPYLRYQNQITYYGHITNTYGSGYVSGTITYSVSTSPFIN